MSDIASKCLYFFDIDGTTLRTGELIVAVIREIAPTLGVSAENLISSYHQYRRQGSGAVQTVACRQAFQAIDTPPSNQSAIFDYHGLCEFWKKIHGINESVPIEEVFVHTTTSLIPDFVHDDVEGLTQFVLESGGEIGVLSQGEDSWQRLKIEKLRQLFCGLTPKKTFVSEDKASKNHLAELAKLLVELRNISNVKEAAIIDDSLTILKAIIANWPRDTFPLPVLYFIDRGQRILENAEPNTYPQEVIRVTALHNIPEKERERKSMSS